MSKLADCTVLLQGFNYSGSGDWLDESGNGHDATLIGSPTFTTDHFVLNGTSQALNISDHADLNFATDESFTVMVRAVEADATPTNYEALINKKGSGAVAGWGIDHPNLNAQLSAYIHDGTTLESDASSNTSDATIYVGILRRDAVANEVEAGLDGTMSGSPTTDATSGTLSNANDVGIGYRASTTSQWLTGSIYAVAIWREALSDAEIAEAAATLVTGYIPTSNLMLLGVG